MEKEEKGTERSNHKKAEKNKGYSKKRVMEKEEKGTERSIKRKEEKYKGCSKKRKKQ